MNDDVEVAEVDDGFPKNASLKTTSKEEEFLRSPAIDDIPTRLAVSVAAPTGL